MDYEIPEILCISLVSPLLQLHAMKIEKVFEFFDSLLTPPKKSTIENAIETLEKIGALTTGELTPLGKLLAKIPEDTECALMLIYASFFGVNDCGISLCSMLSSKSIFSSQLGKFQ